MDAGTSANGRSAGPRYTLDVLGCVTVVAQAPTRVTGRTGLGPPGLE